MSYSIEDPPTDAPKTKPKTRSTTFSARDPMMHAIVLAIISASMIGWAVYTAVTSKDDTGTKAAPVLKAEKPPKEAE